MDRGLALSEVARSITPGFFFLRRGSRSSALRFWPASAGRDFWGRGGGPPHRAEEYGGAALD